MLAEKTGYTIGTRGNDWKGGIAQSLTFVVTEDCNLRCKYCYITHKSSDKRLDLNTAKKFIDYILNAPIKKQDAVVLDFIGGEPLLETKLIDKICDYFKLKTYEQNDNWYWNYRINICTNGVNYNNAVVQRFLSKNYGKLSISITIDGTKEKHDLQRVFPDGTGSYDIVNQNVDLWVRQFPAGTKVTFSSDDLKYLKSSVIELWNKGIEEVNANVVFEDVWKEGDEDIFEKQLVELADYILDNKLYNKYICTLFEDYIGEPYTEELLQQTSCGAGKMLALGPDGKIYPCMRYIAYSLNNRPEYVIGSVEDGIDLEKVRPFQTVTYKLQSDNECLECPVATGCSFCQGFNYDEADTSTNFQRAKYICKMHKARVRANNYFFSKLYNKYNIPRRTDNNEYLRLNFLLSENYISYCDYNNKSTQNNFMSEKTILDGLKFAHQNFMKPVFIYSNDSFDFKDLEEYNSFKILHIVPAKFYNKIKEKAKDYILVFDETNIDFKGDEEDNCIFNIQQENLANLSDYLLHLFKKVKRINLNILEINNRFDFDIYEEQLKKVAGYIVETQKKSGVLKELNVLTDILFLEKHENCNAGITNYTLSPEGDFYICPAFYSNDKTNKVGSLSNGLGEILNQHLYKIDNAPLCEMCDAYHCMNCIYHNLINTNEVNVSSSYQCRRRHIERKISINIKQDLNNQYYFINQLEEINYQEPMEKFIKNYNVLPGYYRTI